MRAPAIGRRMATVIGAEEDRPVMLAVGFVKGCGQQLETADVIVHGADGRLAARAAGVQRIVVFLVIDNQQVVLARPDELHAQSVTCGSYGSE